MMGGTPLFVGGTGRSGTTMVARLIGASPEYYMLPIEVRFLVDPHGLCDVVSGATEFDRFVRHITGPWWHRVPPDGTPRGLHRVLSEPVLTDALSRLAGDLDENPFGAGQKFIRDLLGPLASEAGSGQWIEMTPPNVERGNELLRLVPDMKMIHSVRDGRDVVSSVVPLDWGPNDFFSALDWWADRLLGAKDACDELDASQLFIVEMEDLVSRNRDASLRRLLDFVGLGTSPEILRYFEQEVSASRSSIGRWERDVPLADHDEFNSRYRELLNGLHQAKAPAPAMPVDDPNLATDG